MEARGTATAKAAKAVPRQRRKRTADAKARKAALGRAKTAHRHQMMEGLERVARILGQAQQAANKHDMCKLRDKLNSARVLCFEARQEPILNFEEDVDEDDDMFSFAGGLPAVPGLGIDLPAPATDPLPPTLPPVPTALAQQGLGALPPL